jgi:long-subunit fatty acid transport protein
MCATLHPMLLLALSAHAAGLDAIEVGGIWGSPTATNATSAWWNPAGLALAGGTGFLVEAAPTFARVRYDRTNPDYGPPVDVDGDGTVDPYDYGGSDTIAAAGVAPFAGLHTDFGVRGLGLGVALAVPYGRTGHEVDPPGPGSFHMRKGQLAAVHGLLGAGYRFRDIVAVGVSGAVIASTWSAEVDAETLSVVEDKAGPFVDYADALLENPAYSATLTFDHLHDTAFTFVTGVYVTPTPRVALSVAYVHGALLANTGDIVLTTRCPPESDVVGSVATNALGLCDTVAPGTGGVAYRLPARLTAGAAVRPVDGVRVEAMGGWVGWSVFRDYDIDAHIPASSLPDAAAPDEASALLAQHRKWARNARDTAWVAVDGRWQGTDVVELVARVLYDHPAIPVASVSPNNYDAPTVGVTGAVVLGPVGPVRFGLSAEQLVLARRTVEDSVFGVTLAEDRNPVRTYYPSAAGVYRGAITRLGVAIEARLPDRR